MLNLSVVNETISNLYSTNGKILIQTIGTLLVTGNSTTGDIFASNITSANLNVSGLSILLNQSSTNITSNGLNVTDTAFLNTTNISGITNITNTTNSFGVGNGALNILGGLSVSKDINIGGNATIAGNLFVNGTTTSVNSTTTNISDNLLVVNAGPSGSRDGGYLIQRYQIDNNLGSGDVVAAIEPIALTGLVQTGTTTSVVILPGTSSGVDNFYNGWWIKITSGSANNNIRQIISYIGSTKSATLSSVLISSPSSNIDTFNLYSRYFVGSYYNQSNNLYVFGFSSTDPGNTIITNTGYANVLLGSANIVGSLNVSGGSNLGNIIASGTLNVSGNSTLGNVISNNQTVSNLFATNITTTNLALTSNLTLVGLNVTGLSTFTNAFISNQTVSNSFITNANITSITSSNLRTVNQISTNISTSNIRILTGLTSSNINITGLSVLSNLTANSGSISNLTLSLGITSGNINIINLSTLNTIVANSATLSSLITNTGITSSSLNINGQTKLNTFTSNIGTIGILFNTGITTGTLYVLGTSVLTDTIITNISSNNLTVSGNTILTGGTINNLSSTNITSVNLSITSGIFTNINASSSTFSNLINDNQTVGNLIVNTINITPSLGDIVKEQTFSAINNQSTPSNVTGLIFANGTVRSFRATISITILSTGGSNNKYSIFTLIGIQRQNDWRFNSSFVGDNTGITFSLDPSGQIQYTSKNTASFISNTIKFKSETTSI